jgi:hypothetical protein
MVEFSANCVFDLLFGILELAEDFSLQLLIILTTVSKRIRRSYGQVNFGPIIVARIGCFSRVASVPLTAIHLTVGYLIESVIVVFSFVSSRRCVELPSNKREV